MGRLGIYDKLLLGTLLSIWLACLAFHLEDAARTGLAEPPIYAAPASDRDGYPVVGGYRIERGRGGEELLVGDTLLSLGGTDLRGAGYLSFDAIALDEMDEHRSTWIVIERDGVAMTMPLVMLHHDFPWFRVIPILTAVIVALLVLLRAPSRESRLLYTSVLLIAILETPFGGGYWGAYLSAAKFIAVGGVAFFFSLRWLIEFPPEVPPEDRLSLRWSWLAFLWYVPRISYLAGGGGLVSTDWAPQAALAADGLFILGALSIGTHNYRIVDGIGRRRFKWLLLGSYVGVLPLGISVLLGAIAPDAIDYAFLFESSVILMLGFPIGILIAVSRYNLFDVDRVLSATASWSAVLAATVGVFGALLPQASEIIAEWSGVDLRLVYAGLGVAVVSGSMPLSRRLRPEIERVFFRERVALRRGSDELMRDLSACGGPEDIFLTLAWRIDRLLQPEFFGLYVRSPNCLQELESSGAAPELLPLNGSIDQLLAEYGAPVYIDDGHARLDGSDFDRDERELLAAADCRVLIPVVADASTEAVIALGAKTSGDIYTETERSLLLAIAARASREVQRIRATDLLVAGDAEIETLRAQKEDADASNLAKSRFIASASHDLRQPLHALGLLSEALSQRLGESEHSQLVRRINETVQNLDEMMTGILDLSKLEAGGVTTRIEDFPIDPLLQRIQSEFESQATSRGLELRVRHSPDHVRSDRLLLTRILQNLVVNGLRYTDRGAILVSCRRRGESCLIEVWDTGRGIPAAEQEQVFEEFRQLDGDARQQGPGLGLGLSIVDRLAKLLDHPIWIASTVGRGTRFSILVPRVAAAASPASPIARIPEDGIRGSVVLVIDDEVEIRDGMRAVLEPWGCDVLTASSRDEAIDLVAGSERKPDLIVSDFHLGAGFATGPEAIAAVREASGKEIAALIVTGDTSAISIEDLRAAGHPYLNKPVRPAKLRALMTELLRHTD